MLNWRDMVPRGKNQSRRSLLSGLRLGCLRPAEWVVLGYLFYCGVRLVAGSHPGLAWFEGGFPALRIVWIFVFSGGLRVSLGLQPRLRAAGVSRMASAGPLLLTLLLIQLSVWLTELSEGLDPRLSVWRRVTPTAVTLLFMAWTAGLSWIETGRKPGRPEVGPWLQSLAAGVRECLPIFSIVTLYGLVPPIIRASGAPIRDSSVLAIDRWFFFGADPHQWIARHLYAPLSEWLALAYSGYGVLFVIIMGLLYIRQEREPFRRASFALALTLSLGYVGYTLVPVEGPVFAQSFSTDLSLYYMDAIKKAMIDRTRIRQDCFPSLHTAVSLVLCWIGWRYARLFFWLTLPVLASIPLACVYLRYHYVTDILAGTVLAALVLVAVKRMPNRLFNY